MCRIILHRSVWTHNAQFTAKTLARAIWDKNEDVIKWKHFPRYWPFVRGIHRWPHKGSVTRSFDVFFDLRLNKRLNKQSWGWWFETPSWSLWRHCNDKVLCSLLGVHITNVHNDNRSVMRPMKRSWHGKSFRITSLLWGESSVDHWIPVTKDQKCEPLMFFLY